MVVGLLVRDDAGHRDRDGAAAGAPSVATAVSKFVLAGLAALVLFAVVSVFVVRELGQREAVRDTRDFAELAALGIVEPALTRRAARPRCRGTASGSTCLVQERVLGDRVVRVKLWTRDGRIVYSDEPRLIGAVYARGEDEIEALPHGRDPCRAERPVQAGEPVRARRG